MNEFNQLTITIDLEEYTAGLEGQLFNDGFTGMGTAGSTSLMSWTLLISWNNVL